MMEAARFFAVAMAGLALDLAVAWSAAHFLGLPLWLAAATGFSVAAIANYALHEMWTFRSRARRLSASRAIRYSFVLLITLGSRVATVALLATFLGDTRALPVLLAGAGVSFCVHYLLSKYFVFFNRADLEHRSS
jgi:putative flippase GtrA